jgi:hypothetical protein
MNIVPKNKSDIEACNNLAKATDSEIKENIFQLLEWVQDINWPVASLVCERLKNIGHPLVAPIKEILNSDDNIWKYWVISALISKTPSEIINALRNELEKIVQNPTDGEIKEKVNIVAVEVLKQCK